MVCLYGFRLCVATGIALAVSGGNACVCTIRLVIVSRIINLFLWSVAESFPTYFAYTPMSSVSPADERTAAFRSDAE